MTTPVDPIATAIAVARVLDDLGIAHTIGGSVAASFAGEPRASIDIDFVAALQHEHIAPLVAALSSVNSQIDSGATYSASSGSKDIVSTDTTCVATLVSSTSRICWIAHSGDARRRGGTEHA